MTHGHVPGVSGSGPLNMVGHYPKSWGHGPSFKGSDPETPGTTRPGETEGTGFSPSNGRGSPGMEAKTKTCGPCLESPDLTLEKWLVIPGLYGGSQDPVRTT